MMAEFTSEFLLERSQEIGNKFLAWRLETNPCPININDTYWFKKLCGLFETQAILEQRIAELEQERRWISVKERLPEEEQESLVSYGDGNWVMSAYMYGGKWYDIPYDSPVVPSHWKPLPPPPEGDGE